MTDDNKLAKLVKTNRDIGEAESWIFSIIPICVAFVFYIMFIISMDIEQKGYSSLMVQRLELLVWKVTG